MKVVQEDRSDEFGLQSMHSFAFDEEEDTEENVGGHGLLPTSSRSLSLHSRSGHANSIAMRLLNASTHHHTTSNVRQEQTKLNSNVRESQRVSLQTLGERIESSQLYSALAFPTKQHLRNLCLVILSSLAVVNSGVALFNHFVLPTDANTHQNYDVFENPLEQIMEETIPFVQEWYRADVKETDKLILTPTYGPEAAGYQGNNTAASNHDCLGHFF